MNTAEALQELQRIQQLLPEVVAALSQSGEGEKKVRRYEKAGYFRALYGIGKTTYQDRRDGIREQIKKGRYPETAIQDRLVDKAVFWDYTHHGYYLRNYPRRAPAYDDRACLEAAMRMEGKETDEG